ncbi:MAG: cytochrome c-type biogenesis protein CcmH, partial [Dehalococcoidia bacterium]
ERLDVCSNAICNDMKRVIRERLAAGSTPDDIILYFETRFGPKVRAKLPREGFNLVLFGWVGGALTLSGLAAGYALYSLRRDSRRRRVATAAAPPPADDRWVDALMDEAEDGDAPRGTR